jgi:hypothetical protein
LETRTLEAFVKLSRPEIGQILRGSSSPERSALVEVLTPFLQEGIVGIGFSWMAEPRPVPERDENVLELLRGLAEGQSEATEKVVAFIDKSGVPFSNIFRDHLKKLMGKNRWQED